MKLGIISVEVIFGTLLKQKSTFFVGKYSFVLKGGFVSRTYHLKINFYGFAQFADAHIFLGSV